MSKNFCAFCRKIFGSAVETPLYVSIRTICRKYFSFDRIENFKYFSDIERNRFCLSSEYFRRCCRDCFQLVHGDNKKENKLFEFLYQFETLSQNFLALFRQTFGRVVKTAFYLSIRTVWGKTIFWRTYVLFILLGHWAKTFWPFFSNFFEGFSNCIPHVHRNSFRKNIFFKNLCFFKSLRSLSNNISAFFSKSCRRGCQKCFLLVHRKSLRKNTFLKNVCTFVFFIILGFWAKTLWAFFWKNFRRVCQNCILHLPRNSLRKNNVLKNLGFSYYFRTLSKHFLAFFRIIFGGNANTVFYMAKRTVSEKHFFQKSMFS